MKKIDREEEIKSWKLGDELCSGGYSTPTHSVSYITEDTIALTTLKANGPRGAGYTPVFPKQAMYDLGYRRYNGEN